MYKIVRMYTGKATNELGHVDSARRTIRRGLTLEEAQAHCKDPETSSSTCSEAKRRKVCGIRWVSWFDGYQEQ